MSGVAADKKDRGCRVVFVDNVVDLLAVPVRHDHIEDGQIDAILLVEKQADRLLAVFGHQDPVSMIF